MTDAHRIHEFIELFTRHEARVHAFIFSLLGDWDAAEEVAAETNGILWRKFDEFEPGSSFYAWACQVARFEVMRYRRNQRRQPRFSDVFIERIADRSAALSEELAERQRALADCIAKLPPQGRDIVQRRYMESGSVEEIARQTNRTAAAVYKALARLRQALYDCIERTLSGGSPA